MAARFSANAIAVSALLGAYVVASTLNAVLWVRLSDVMAGYDTFVAQVAFPLAMNALLWPVVWVLLWRGKIDSTQRSFPTYKYLVVALLSAGNNLLNAIPSPHLAGSLQTVLNTLAVPSNMLWSRVLLRSRFAAMHYVAAGIIVAGVVVAVVPSFKVPTTGAVVWVVVFALQFALPRGVVEERYVKEAALNVWYFRAKYALAEVVFGWLLLPTIWIPRPHGSSTAAVAPADTGRFLHDAAACLLALHGAPDSCATAPQLFGLFMASTTAMNLLSLAVVKYASQATASVVGALNIVLQAALFHWAWLAGPAAEHGFSPWLGVALALVVCGVVLFRVQEEHSPQRTYRLVADEARGETQPLLDSEFTIQTRR